MSELSYIETYQQGRARDREHLLAAKPVLIAALTSIGVAHVEIEYDGEGDSGQINSILGANDRGETVDLRKPHPVSIGQGDRQSHYDSLEEFIEDFAWDLLGQYHDGFENNDGGFGRVTIEVADARITLDHNDRVVESVNTETEF
jgi:Family of unknown function (DUF6878)